eukprot:766513-Hanusia_phi.AAC.1
MKCSITPSRFNCNGTDSSCTGESHPCTSVDRTIRGQPVIQMRCGRQSTPGLAKGLRQQAGKARVESDMTAAPDESSVDAP